MRWKKTRTVIFICCAAIFTILAVSLDNDSLLSTDAKVGDWIRGFATQQLTDAMSLISLLGSSAVLAGLAVLIGLYLFFGRRQRQQAIVLIGTLAGAWLISTVVKEWFQRPRPAIEHLVEASGYSFPSANAVIAVSFYGMIGYLLCTYIGRRYFSSWVIALLTIIVIGAIGISRIYAGVHYPSDIVAGYVLGGVWLSLCTIAIPRKKEFFFRW